MGRTHQVGEHGGSAAASAAAFSWWSRGITRTCVGAWALMSRKATQASVSATTSAARHPRRSCRTGTVSPMPQPAHPLAEKSSGGVNRGPATRGGRAEREEVGVPAVSAPSSRTAGSASVEAAASDERRRGDRDLHADHTEMVRSRCSSRDQLLAEDVVQDAFITLHRRWDRLDDRRRRGLPAPQRRQRLPVGPSTRAPWRHGGSADRTRGRAGTGGRPGRVAGRGARARPRRAGRPAPTPAKC